MAAVVAARPLQPVLPLISLGAAIGIVELVGGFMFPAMALSLEARGASLGMIGAQAAMVGLGLMLSALLVPWLSGRLGAVRLGLVNLVLTGLAVLAFGLLDHVGWWFGLGLMLGVTANVWYVQSETWLNQLAPDHSRGRTLGLVNGVREGAAACGPLLIPLLGHLGATPYALMAAVLAAAGLLLPGLGRHVAQPAAPRLTELLATARAMPVLLLAVAVSGYFDGAVLPFWLIYAAHQGVATDQAALTLTLIVLGNIGLQLPIGWLADKVPAQLVLAICALGAAFGALLLPQLDLASWLAWPFLLGWGALSFGVYTVALILIGRHLPAERLVVATATFGVAWGAGALLGSAVTGQITATFGPDGLTTSVALAYAVLIGGLAHDAAPVTIRPRTLPA
jgi:MFS family permease